MLQFKEKTLEFIIYTVLYDGNFQWVVFSEKSFSSLQNHKNKKAEVARKENLVMT